MKKIAIIGSTGSIGTQTLDVISQNPERYQVEALAAGSNIDLLVKQALLYRPKLVSLGSKALAEEAAIRLPASIRITYGEEGLLEAAAGTEADFVVMAIMGSAGLKATLAAIEARKPLGLANKETLVTAGHLVMARASLLGVPVLPIDSEHSAIFQCLNGERLEQLHKITITASGGSFRDKSRAELEGVTVEQALRHPNWSMGAKITIDSATMANKGLEVIEAKWFFGVDYSRIEVIMHPESIIHSMVEFNDHSVIAQLGLPDMRVPIQYALSYPDRLPNGSGSLDLVQLGKLTFREMDYTRFPCLQYAFDSGRAGKSAPTVFNAANEVAVARFLGGEIPFLGIDDTVGRILEKHQVVEVPDVDAIAEVDAWARREAAIAL